MIKIFKILILEATLRNVNHFFIAKTNENIAKTLVDYLFTRIFASA